MLWVLAYSEKDRQEHLVVTFYCGAAGYKEDCAIVVVGVFQLTQTTMLEQYLAVCHPHYAPVKQREGIPEPQHFAFLYKVVNANV